MTRGNDAQLEAAKQNSLQVDQRRTVQQISFRPSPVPPAASVPLRGTLDSSSVAQSTNARQTTSNSGNNNLPTSSIVSASTPRPPQRSSLVNSHATLQPSSKLGPPTTLSEIQSVTDSLGQTAAALPMDSTEDNTIVEDSEGEGAEPRTSTPFVKQFVTFAQSSTLQCWARLNAPHTSHSRHSHRQSSSNQRRQLIHSTPRLKYNNLLPVFLLRTTSTTPPFRSPRAKSNDT